MKQSTYFPIERACLAVLLCVASLSVSGVAQASQVAGDTIGRVTLSSPSRTSSSAPAPKPTTARSTAPTKAASTAKR